MDPLLTETVSSYVLLGVCSAQRSAARSRSLTEELEETRRASKEAQERAGRTQTSCTKLVQHRLNSPPVKLPSKYLCIFHGQYLCFNFFFCHQSNEVECLKVHIRRLEDKVM